MSLSISIVSGLQNMVQNIRLDRLSVCVSSKCIVAKRLIESGCRLGGEWRRSRYGVLDGLMIVEGEGAVLGVNLEHPIVTNGAFVT